MIKEVLEFWFTKPMSDYWFGRSTQIDDTIRERFEGLWQKGANGELQSWQNTPEGCLALCIVLDQFPLNMFRGDPTSFQTEQMAVAVAKHAIANQFHQKLPIDQVGFLFMPFMHSENIDDQNTCIELFESFDLQQSAHFAHHHKNLIKQFGRFPHRNAILGRKNTPEETQYLASDDAFLG